MNSKVKLRFGVAIAAVMATSSIAYAYETTTFSISLADPAVTGEMSLGESSLGNGTSSLSNGANTYDVAYQYFTPSVTGTYVFGQLSAPQDTVILVYSPSYSTSTPVANFIAMNDDGDISSISDSALRSYVTTAIASRDCGGDPELCPLLAQTLTAGVDYYIVVSTYNPAAALGTSGTLSFFVIGDATVAVGGGGYVDTAAPTPVTGLANYLDGYDNSGSLSTVASALDGMNASEVQEALKRIFPVNATVNSQVMTGAMSQGTQVLLDKIGTVLGNINTPGAAAFNGQGLSGWTLGGALAARAATPVMGFAADTTRQGAYDIVNNLASQPYQRFASGRQALWSQGVLGVSRGDDSPVSIGYKNTSKGFVLGYEYSINDTMLAGVMGSLFRSTINMDGNAGGTDASTYTLGVYGQKLLGSTKLSGVVLLSYGDYNSERFVDVGGVTGRPEATYNGYSTSATLTASHLLQHGSVSFEPFASLNFTAAWVDGYTEQNGGVYNMTVGSDTSSSVAGKLGVTVQKNIAYDERTLQLKARPYVAYQQEINGSNNSVSLSGATTSTVMNGRDSSALQVGLGLEASYEFSSSQSIKIGVDASHSKLENAGMAFVGYGVKF